MADKKTNTPNGYTVTTTEIYDEDGALTEIQKVTAPRGFSSVEISVDSKGNVKPAVKVYHEDPEEALKTSMKLMRQAMNWANENGS